MIEYSILVCNLSIISGGHSWKQYTMCIIVTLLCNFSNKVYRAKIEQVYSLPSTSQIFDATALRW